MNIATIGINYPQTRLVLNSGIEWVNYTSYQNYWNPFLKRIFHTYEIYKPFLQDVDGYHVINTIMLTDKPWCMNFETMIPRGRQCLHVNHHDSFDMQPGWYMKYLLGICAKDNCKKLMAFSECNLNLQNKVYNLYPDIAKGLKEKTCLVNVPQPLLADHPQEKINKGKIRFFFVGNDFVRKGVPEVINALARLRKKRKDFELIVVTKTQNTYAYCFDDFQLSKDEIHTTLKIIEDSKDWLTLYPHLPFSKVKKLMRSCDVGLLTTWAETYGYSTLEMQASGLPVVSTNIRALPETNAKGWLLKLPVNYCGELALKNKGHRIQIRDMMIEQLYCLFDEILDNRESIVNKSVDSYNFIATVHSPEKYRNTLADIYRNF